MGQLNNILGQASSLAKGSSLFAGLSTGLEAGKDFFGGVAESQLYGYQAQVAANNAAISRQNATGALAAGSFEESQVKLQGGQLQGAEKVAQGANGVDLSVGSPAAVRASAGSVSAMEAAIAHFNAAREAYGLETQGANFDAQAALDQAAAGNAKSVGVMKSLDTILGGATSLSSKWRQYQLSGASTGSYGKLVGKAGGPQ